MDIAELEKFSRICSKKYQKKLLKYRKPSKGSRNDSCCDFIAAGRSEMEDQLVRSALKEKI